MNLQTELLSHSLDSMSLTRDSAQDGEQQPLEVTARSFQIDFNSPPQDPAEFARVLGSFEDQCRFVLQGNPAYTEQWRQANKQLCEFGQDFQNFLLLKAFLLESKDLYSMHVAASSLKKLISHPRLWRAVTQQARHDLAEKCIIKFYRQPLQIISDLNGPENKQIFLFQQLRNMVAVLVSKVLRQTYAGLLSKGGLITLFDASFSEYFETIHLVASAFIEDPLPEVRSQKLQTLHMLDQLLDEMAFSGQSLEHLINRRISHGFMMTQVPQIVANSLRELQKFAAPLWRAAQADQITPDRIMLIVEELEIFFRVLAKGLAFTSKSLDFDMLPRPGSRLADRRKGIRAPIKLPTLTFSQLGFDLDPEEVPPHSSMMDCEPQQMPRFDSTLPMQPAMIELESLKPKAKNWEALTRNQEILRNTFLITRLFAHLLRKAQAHPELFQNSSLDRLIGEGFKSLFMIIRSFTDVLPPNEGINNVPNLALLSDLLELMHSGEIPSEVFLEEPALLDSMIESFRMFHKKNTIYFILKNPNLTMQYLQKLAAFIAQLSHKASHSQPPSDVALLPILEEFLEVVVSIMTQAKEQVGGGALVPIANNLSSELIKVLLEKAGREVLEDDELNPVESLDFEEGGFSKLVSIYFKTQLAQVHHELSLLVCEQERLHMALLQMADQRQKEETILAKIRLEQRLACFIRIVTSQFHRRFPSMTEEQPPKGSYDFKIVGLIFKCLECSSKVAELPINGRRACPSLNSSLFAFIKNFFLLHFLRNPRAISTGKRLLRFDDPEEASMGNSDSSESPIMIVNRSLDSYFLPQTPRQRRRDRDSSLSSLSSYIGSLSIVPSTDDFEEVLEPRPKPQTQFQGSITALDRLVQAMDLRTDIITLSEMCLVKIFKTLALPGCVYGDSSDLQCKINDEAIEVLRSFLDTSGNNGKLSLMIALRTPIIQEVERQKVQNLQLLQEEHMFKSLRKLYAAVFKLWQERPLCFDENIQHVEDHVIQFLSIQFVSDNFGFMAKTGLRTLNILSGLFNGPSTPEEFKQIFDWFSVTGPAFFEKCLKLSQTHSQVGIQTLKVMAILGSNRTGRLNFSNSCRIGFDVYRILSHACIQFLQQVNCFQAIPGFADMSVHPREKFALLNFRVLSMVIKGSYVPMATLSYYGDTSFHQWMKLCMTSLLNIGREVCSQLEKFQKESILMLFGILALNFELAIQAIEHTLIADVLKEIIVPATFSRNNDIRANGLALLAEFTLHLVQASTTKFNKNSNFQASRFIEDNRSLFLTILQQFVVALFFNNYPFALLTAPRAILAIIIICDFKTQRGANTREIFQQAIETLEKNEARRAKLYTVSEQILGLAPCFKTIGAASISIVPDGQELPVFATDNMSTSNREKFADIFSSALESLRRFDW